ncbi:conserved hypothetical protein [Gloeothece citriformis PCC 7424]|uniref:Uncharacterized protein n=1 Tax=Gloeothece citriformis (strain PCC 7424) TaxID=65393 RepID=B7KI46_GLOC7|nr:hypothetical protein [Gloeothece citriformis]ACK73533.1 conserved hypothetical protein [Gloeothece citriformis PCC 7424]
MDIQSKREEHNQFNWRVWAAILVVVSGTVGFTATSLLLKLPQTPNCPRIFWPIASASMRLYCAQLEAQKKTVDSLLKAIELVEALPGNHPLRTEINRNVEEWSLDILSIAEEEFQKGELEKAIATARKIPEKVEAYNLIEERIERWRSIWEKGEEIFAEVEKQLRNANWNLAFRSAIELLNLDNKYWATIKYDETVENIQLAKEESSKLDTAYVLLRRGGLDNWFKAIEEAQKIGSSSYAYQEAQNVIDKAKEKLLSYIQNLIDNRAWYELQEVAQRIPEKLSLTEEVRDWKAIASAGIDASTGTVDSLQAAILAAEVIESSSPLYDTAQQLIGRWKNEVEDVKILSQARDIAISGTVEDLGSAIAQAELIPRSNPRYQEAQQEIKEWTRQIQLIEDQPILEQARLFAGRGDIPALQEAISQASLIGSGRTLYPEAQEEIRQWRRSIERQQDRPFLDQAQALANAKDYQSAIDMAGQIGRGRVLYPQAQDNINQWRREIKAQQDLQEALLIAQGRTSEALVTAITIVRRIPSSTEVGSQGRQALDRWSYQLLALSSERANQGLLQEAIRLARIIPSESSAYSSAQAQIQVWRKLLQPPAPPVTPVDPVTPPPSVMETNYQ